MSNIINLSDKKQKTKEKIENTDNKEPTDFTEEMIRNKKLEEKRRKERIQENESVKRNYRLRPHDPNNKR